MPVQQSWLSHCSSSHVCHWLPASLLEHQGAAFSLYTLPTAFVPLWVGNTRYNVKLSPFRKAITKSQTVEGLSVWVSGWSMGRQGNFRLGLNLKTTDQRISKGKMQLATKSHDSQLLSLLPFTCPELQRQGAAIPQMWWLAPSSRAMGADVVSGCGHWKALAWKVPLLSDPTVLRVAWHKSLVSLF